MFIIYYKNFRRSRGSKKYFDLARVVFPLLFAYAYFDNDAISFLVQLQQKQLNDVFSKL